MIDVKEFLVACESIEAQKGISKDVIVNALKEAFEKAYIKVITGGVNADYKELDPETNTYVTVKLPDPRVKVEIDQEKGLIYLYQIKEIVATDDDITDDMLQITLEEAEELTKGKKAQDALEVGQDFIIHDTDEEDKGFTTAFATAVKNNLRQKLSEAEKTVLYENYKDRIGEMITGTVEKVEDRFVMVNIGKTTVTISRKDMIGDESFNVGQQIRLYLADVSATSKGPMINITRSDAGFLRRLFEEEIHEIYDGTVVIKGIARQAGVRSKVAVWASDKDVDATGACIGKDGGRINKIVSQLGGNGRDKEKIDIVAYSQNPGLYIIDAIRPAEVIGVQLGVNEEGKPTAIAVVKDGQFSLAIGHKGANIRLAVKLTGYNITVKEESQAKEEGIEFTSRLELQAQEAARVEEEVKNAFAKQSIAYKEKLEAEKAARELEEAKKAAEASYEAHEEETHVTEEPVQEVKEEKVPEAPAHVEIKTTTTLADLENQIESEKREQEKKSSFSKSRRPRKITEDEIPDEAKDDKKDEAKKENYMDIYTEEELREMEEEESAYANEDDNYDDDVDYDEYDKYYDEDEK